MAAKAFFVFCASALLIQSISGQSIDNTVNAGEISINNVGITGNGIGLMSGGSGFGNGVSMGAGYGIGQGMAGSGLGITGSGLGITGSGLGITGSGLGVAGYGSGCGAGLGLGAAGFNGAYNTLNNGLVASVNGGSFTVTSSSPLAPTGLSVASENVIEGPVAVIGALPFLSAVTLEGQLPNAGAAGVQYSCGNGNVGIVTEGVGAAAGLAGAGLAGAGAGLGAAGLAGAGRWASTGLGYGTGLSAGCGCGALY